MKHLQFTLLTLTVMFPYFQAEIKGQNTGYFEKVEGFVLKAKALKEKKVRSDFECGLRCARYEECSSFNYALKADQEGLHFCQLLQSNEHENHELFSDSTEFHYFRRLKLTCESQTCLNGGTCTSAPGEGSNYTCICPAGFLGDNCETGKWVKFNESPVVVGTTTERPGTFNITLDGDLITIKLVYISGYVTRYKDNPETRSHWYVNAQNTGLPLPELGIIIADQNRNLVLPEKKDLNEESQYSYAIPGYDTMSPEIVFRNFATPRRVKAFDRLDIWYRQDFINFYELYCDGTLEVDVYGLYV